MRAVVYDVFQGPLAVESVPDPEPPPDGVVIQVRASGLCRSDWHGWMGHDADIRLPHVPGHEFAGEVIALGPEVNHCKLGDRVTVPFSVGCGFCPQCQTGDHQICDRYYQPGFTAWGSFAEQVAIPHADVNLVRLPDTLTWIEAASLGCRFMTSFRALTEQGKLAAGQWLAVFGCGGVGLSAIMIGKALGAATIGIDIHTDTLRLATETGARHVIDASVEEDAVAAVIELTRGGAHVSIDALGSAITCRQSIRCLRKQGRHVQIGLLSEADLAGTVPMDLVVARELQILGSHGMSARAFGPLLQMIANGQLRPRQLVTRIVQLDQIPELLPAMPAKDWGGTTVANVE